jgi:hypothetical protein
MPDEVTADRVCAIADVAGVVLDRVNAERVAVAATAALKQLAAEKIPLPLEVEPTSFAVVARQAAKP